MSGKALLDVTRLLARALEGRLQTGVDRVALSYVAHFRERSLALVRFGGRWVVLREVSSLAIFDALLDPQPGFAWLVRQQVALGYLLSWGKHREAFLLNVSHSGLDDPGFAKEVKRRGIKAIFFLHDLIPIAHPEYSRLGEAEKHHRRLTSILSAGKGVIVNSADTRDALNHYAVKVNADIPPCLVAPLAPAKLPSPVAGRPLEQPYFVVLGTIEPRKNHLLLLHVWRQLVTERGGAAPRLVVIGQRGWECEQVIDLLERCETLKDHVIEKFRCGDQELATWLHHARALLFPSFAEGYGLPLVEALALGVPVIASDLPVFQEIAGDIPEYLDPLDGPGWKRAILEYLPESSVPRARQCERIRQFVVPTWERHFALVDDFLKSLDDGR